MADVRSQGQGFRVKPVEHIIKQTRARLLGARYICYKVESLQYSNGERSALRLNETRDKTRPNHEEMATCRRASVFSHMFALVTVPLQKPLNATVT